MTSYELLRKILVRLNNFKYLIIIASLLIASLLFIIAKNTPALYSVKSTLYPLSAGSGDKSSTSKLSDLIGGNSNTKTLSDEANVNIEEVAKSKKTREAVVAEKLPEFANKALSVILIEDYNKNRSFLSPALKIPTLQSELNATGVQMLAGMYTVKFNKNSLLEISVSSKNDKILTPVSLILIDKISEFYKELKIKKAQLDYDFAQQKLDSLESVLRKYDSERIRLNNTTLFVQPGKLQYTVPKEILENNRMLVLAQRNGAASNREEALWRKQKVTPLIELLDNPQPPYDVIKPSKIIYGTVGFIVGVLLFSLLSIVGIVYKFAKLQVRKKLEETMVDSTVNITTTTTLI